MRWNGWWPLRLELRRRGICVADIITDRSSAGAAATVSLPVTAAVCRAPLGPRFDIIRRATPLPVVGIPGPDLLKSTDWIVREIGSSKTFQLLSSAHSGRELQAESGALLFANVAPSPERGHWRITPVGDGTSFQRFVLADDPGRGLSVVEDRKDVSDDLRLALGPIRQNDRSGMWLLQEKCVADARSIHLRYGTPPDLALFYNEVYPLETPPGTYFCAAGFGVDSRGPHPGGYAGIQERTDGSRLVIFSVWHRLIDGEQPIPGARATAVAVHPRAHETPFSGEGSGTSIRLPLNWQIDADQPIRFVLTAEGLGDDTVLSAYVALGPDSWISIGNIVRGGTGGRLMSHPYAFIEDFARTGNTAGVPSAQRSPYRVHSAKFANPWLAQRSTGPNLEPITRAEFTAYGPHPLENLMAEQSPESGDFGLLLATGTPLARQDPPIGHSYRDRSSRHRTLPNLSGVPFGG